MESVAHAGTTRTIGSPSKFTRWLKAVRAYSFTASMVPVAVGALLALADPLGVNWWLLPFVVLSVLFLHVGTNLVNDYYDYDLGLDHAGALGGSGVLVSGELSARQIGRAAWGSFVVAALLGIPIIAERGWPVLALGAAGILGGALYTAKPVQYKYWGAGDLLVFLLMGPLMVGGTHFVLTGVWTLAPWIVSIPIGFLVTAILHANNLRDLDMDAEFELKTLAIRLGRRGSIFYLDLLLAGSYAALIAMVVAGVLPPGCLLALLSAPLAVGIARRARTLRDPGGPDIVGMSAGVHLFFGVGLALGLIAQAFLGIG